MDSDVTTGPLVSVIMNCYNGEKFLRQAVDSVLAQSYQNWEVIFWDNQSTDRSAEIFQSYSDPRLKYFRAPSHTAIVYEARNYAIERSSGEFIAFLDVDDWWLPGKLATQLPLFADPEVAIVCGNYWIVSEKKSGQWLGMKGPRPAGRVLDDLLASYYVGLLTLMVRRSALDPNGCCDPRYHVRGDFELVLRLARRWKLEYVQEPLGVCRKHEDSVLARHLKRHIEELELWIEEASQLDDVRSCAHFSNVRHECTYLKVMEQVLAGDRAEAIRHWRQLPLGMMSARLAVAIALPTSVARRLKN